jgi:anti-sigma factor RsiW
MTPSRSRRAPSLMGNTDEYSLWDAACVLGSLSSADHRRFGAHLNSCRSCRESVNELSAMPALLAQLDRRDVAAIDEGGWNATTR